MNETSERSPDAVSHAPTIALPHIVTVGRHRIGRVLERVSQSFDGQARITHISASFDTAVDAALALHARTPIDALVVAGASGAWIRKRVDIPVAMIEVRGFDLLGALARARALSPRVALVTFGASSEQLTQFDAQFGAGIAQFSYHGAEDARACVQAMQTAEIGAVVAPGLVADLAEEAGMKSVLLYSDAAVQQALSEALLLARQRLAERTRHQWLETILGQLQDGVVAVDCDQRIQALNPAMAALLAMPAEQLHGRVLGAVAPQLDMADTLERQESSEDVVQLATRTQVVRRAPITEYGQLTGALLVCRDPQTIQNADRHLRANQRQRGSGVRWRIDDYLGDSPAVQRLRALAHQCAGSDATVLILGESGTGKELVAQGIHRASRRAAQPFLAVNCAALGESLLESELFGYEEGAFTGARRGGKTGLVEAAHTGTLFLDEIGDMPLALQSRLLRVLQEREVLRVGSTAPIPVDVRVIAATHADLGAQVDKGLFRRDLYYRLAVLRLATPALRERSAKDVAQLAQALLRRRLRVAGESPPAAAKMDAAKLLDTMLQRAQTHTWPGNVRELENWVERLLACQAYVCDAQGAADAARLLEVFPECAEPLAMTLPAHAAQPALPLKDTRRRAEQQRLREVLALVQGDQRQACEILGISRATLWRRMKN